MITFLTLGLFAIAGLCFSIMWKIQFHWERSVFSEIKGTGAVWFSHLGWALKYKDGDPKKGPAFPGSTTVFVWLTDAFHFFQLLAYTSLEAAVVLHGFDVFELLGSWVEALSRFPTWAMFVLNLAALKGCRGILFELTFSYLFDMNFWNKISSSYRAWFADNPRGASILSIGALFLVILGLTLLPEPYNIWLIVILGLGAFVILFIRLARSFLSKTPNSKEEAEESSKSQ